MKKHLFLLIICLLSTFVANAAKIYVNPGHGSWNSNSRPMATIPYPNTTDTLGFWESNTNLWKCLYLEKKLKAAGHTVVMSRRANGGTWQENNSPYDKALSVIATEAETSGADYFISVHSNAIDNYPTYNYPLYLYRGTNSSDYSGGGKEMAQTAWTHLFALFDSGLEHHSHYSLNSKNIAGDISFMGSSKTTTTNGKSYTGYYAVLRHGIPGYLIEGYFHTYQPARHRALNPDWCCQEGLRHYRGIQAHFSGSAETKGYIMGYIRTKEKEINQTNYSNRSGNDIYMPINGAKVQLRDASGNIIKTDCYPYVARELKNQYYYTTDNNYNGVFVFSDLTPGTYTVTVYKSGYADYTQTLTVTADKTTYTQIFLTSGTGTEPVSTPATLNPYAYDVNAELSDNQQKLTISFKLNAPADVDMTTQTNKGKGVQVFIVDNSQQDEQLRRCDTLMISRTDLVNNHSAGKEYGEFEYTMSTAQFPRNKELSIEVVVHGLIHSAPVQDSKYVAMFCPQGIDVDTDPMSEHFGRILVTETMHNEVTSGSFHSKASDGKIKAGIYAFAPDLTPLNTAATVYNGGLDFTMNIGNYTLANGSAVMHSQQPWLVKISQDGRIFVSSLDKRADHTIIWELSKDLQTWTPLIQGSSTNANYDVLDANSKWLAGPNCSMDVTGTGSNLKLLLYSTNKNGWEYDATGYRLDEYAIRTSTKFQGSPSPITAFTKTQNGNIAYGTIHNNVKVIYDGEGGYWFGGSRNTGNEVNIAHINANGQRDYATTSSDYHGGSGIMIHQSTYADPNYSNTPQKWFFKGITPVNSDGRFKIFVMSKDGSGKPVLTERWTVQSTGLGRYHNAFAVDYAHNLYITGNIGEKVIAFALPYSGTTTTPYRGSFKITINTPVYTVKTQSGNANYGTVSGGGLFYAGEEATVTASSKNGASFSNWTDGATGMSEDANYTFSVSKNVTLTANFMMLSSEVTWHNLLKSADHSNIDVDNTTELWELFMPIYNDYTYEKRQSYTRATQELTSTGMLNWFAVDNSNYYANLYNAMTNDDSPFVWLRDFIISVAGKPTSSGNQKIAQEWAVELIGFFLQKKYTHSTYGTSADYSINGTPEKWLPYYREYICNLHKVMDYEDNMPISIGSYSAIKNATAIANAGSNRPNALPSWYVSNNESGKLLAWYYEEDPANPTWPENPTIVHHVDHSGALFATWIEKRIYEDKNNVDVIKLMQNPQHTTTHNLYVNRKLVGGMLNTISFPFTVELDGLSNSHLLKTNNAKAYEFVGVSDPDEYGNIKLLFDEVRTLEKGIPYLMQVDNDITEPLYFSGIDKNDLVYDGGSSETHSGITFHAVISPTHIPERAIIVVTNNRIALTSDAGEMKGLRAYFTSLDTELLSLANTNKIKISLRQDITSDIPLAPEAEQPAQPKVQKIMRNGNIYILRGDEVYTISGVRVK